jgi:hypothetical protein
MNQRNLYRILFLMIAGMLTTAGLSSCRSKRIMVKYGPPPGSYQIEQEQEKPVDKAEKGTVIETKNA